MKKDHCCSCRAASVEVTWLVKRSEIKEEMRENVRVKLILISCVTINCQWCWQCVIGCFKRIWLPFDLNPGFCRGIFLLKHPLASSFTSFSSFVHSLSFVNFLSQLLMLTFDGSCFFNFSFPLLQTDRLGEEEEVKMCARMQVTGRSGKVMRGGWRWGWKRWRWTWGNLAS